MSDGRFDSLTIGSGSGLNLFLSPSGIKLHDETGVTRAELMMEDESPVLLMYDRNGQERLVLLLDPDGTPHVRLQDANGKKRADVEVNTEGSPLLQFYDATEVARLNCTLIDGQTPSLSFHSRDEELRFHLLLHDDETTMFVRPKTGEEHWHYLLSQLIKKGRA